MRNNAIGKCLGLSVLGVTVSLIFAAQATLQNNFWTEAAQSNNAEIAMSNIALQKSQNEQVRQYAQQMITDHTAAAQEMATAAASKNVTLPTNVDSRQSAAQDRLNRADARNFDREYMRAMVDSHERAVRLFERQSRNQTDTDAQAFATRLLPTLQSHLQMARSLNTSVRSGSGNNATNNRAGNTNSMNNMNMGNNTNSMNNMNMGNNTNSMNNMNMGNNTNSTDNANRNNTNAANRTNSRSNTGNNTNMRTNTNTGNNTNTRTNTNSANNTNGNNSNVNNR